MDRERLNLTTKDMQTPRYQRAMHLTNMVLSVARDFIPRNCQREFEEELFRMAWETNSTIINVPPEYDALKKLQLEEAMLTPLIKGFDFGALGESDKPSK